MGGTGETTLGELVARGVETTKAAQEALRVLEVVLRGVPAGALGMTVGVCGKCGGLFMVRRKGTKFCSGRCRGASAQAALRGRRRSS